jgi:hypothetical protein
MCVCVCASVSVRVCHAQAEAWTYGAGGSVKAGWLAKEEELDDEREQVVVEVALVHFVQDQVAHIGQKGRVAGQPRQQVAHRHKCNARVPD